MIYIYKSHIYTNHTTLNSVIDYQCSDYHNMIITGIIYLPTSSISKYNLVEIAEVYLFNIFTMY